MRRIKMTNNSYLPQTLLTLISQSCKSLGMRNSVRNVCDPSTPAMTHLQCILMVK